MQAPAPFEPFTGAVIGGKFRVDRLVARGGMGSIWAGWDTDLERPVAIKFMDLKVSSSPEQRARFDREAKAAARLRTPHVVQIFAHGVEGGRPYIVMELLEGEDLGARLKREHRISLASAARIGSQVARALRRAHESGIVHRDLKPQNVFLARHDDEEIVKVLDFGIAKRTNGDVGDDSTRTGEILGSPHYMSPEQARGLREIDPRSDLWSLAVILFRAVAGELPFKGEAIGDTIYKICSAPIPSVRSFAPDLPVTLDAFFERALAREPADRFQTAMDLIAAFQAAAGVDPAAVPPPSQVPRNPIASGVHSVGSDTPPMTPASGSIPGVRGVPINPYVPRAAEGFEATPGASGSGTFHHANGTHSIPAARPVSPRVLFSAAAVAFMVVGGGLAAVLLGGGKSGTIQSAAPGESAETPTSSATAPRALEPSVSAEPSGDPTVATPVTVPAPPVEATATVAAPVASASASTTTHVAPSKPSASMAKPVAPPGTATAKPVDWGY